MISLTELTIENINNGFLETQLLELYLLRNCLENNPPWHYNESVYNHTLFVLAELERLFEEADLPLKYYLQQVSYKTYSRRQLLFATAVFHDIGKPETLKVEGSKRYCPAHEEEGAKKSISDFTKI